MSIGVTLWLSIPWPQGTGCLQEMMLWSGARSDFGALDGAAAQNRDLVCNDGRIRSRSIWFQANCCWSNLSCCLEGTMVWSSPRSISGRWVGNVIVIRDGRRCGDAGDSHLVPSQKDLMAWDNRLQLHLLEEAKADLPG